MPTPPAITPTSKAEPSIKANASVTGLDGRRAILGSLPKLHHSAMRLLEEDLKARPWATHKQRNEFLFAACGVEVSETTICRAIKKRLSPT
jgi:hypothetical protein